MKPLQVRNLLKAVAENIHSGDEADFEKLLDAVDEDATIEAQIYAEYRMWDGVRMKIAVVLLGVSAAVASGTPQHIKCEHVRSVRFLA